MLSKVPVVVALAVIVSKLPVVVITPASAMEATVPVKVPLVIWIELPDPAVPVTAPAVEILRSDPVAFAVAVEGPVMLIPNPEVRAVSEIDKAVSVVKPFPSNFIPVMVVLVAVAGRVN